MAYAMTKRGSQDNVITYEFICDTLEDMNAIENKYRTLGTIAIVLGDGLEVYIAGSNKEWNSLSTINSGDASGAGGGLSIYICGQNEVSNGVPDVSDPDETTIYLIASGNTSGNLYEEYIYVDGAWEKFGAASIDLSNYATKSEIPDTSLLAPKADPTFTGTVTIGDNFVSQFTAFTWEANKYYNDSEVVTYNSKYYICNIPHQSSSVEDLNNTNKWKEIDKPEYSVIVATNKTNLRVNSFSIGELGNIQLGGTAIGYQSVAMGNGVATTTFAVAEGYATASGIASHAEGYWSTTASGSGSHAEGLATSAIGIVSHSEGSGAQAIGNYSHAENVSAHANGIGSHAEGYFTIASGDYTHASGIYNVDDPVLATDWTANTAYNVGDIVKYSNTYYKCKIANNSASFNNSQWDDIHYNSKMAFIIGNGKVSVGSHNRRSNAFALEWTGDGHLNGDLYVKCNADSTGGQKVLTANDLNLNEYVEKSEGEMSQLSIGRSNTGHVGSHSAAIGDGVIASGMATLVSGQFNIEDEDWPEWEANTEYKVGDIVRIIDQVDDWTDYYICKTDNNDSTFNSSHWEYDIDLIGNYRKQAVIVGNGTWDNNRSNAYALDWDGTGHYAGDLYVNCNNDSSGGTKVATVNQIPDTSLLATKANPEFSGNVVVGPRNNSNVSGTNSMVIGLYNYATGNNALVVGTSGAKVSGDNSLAVGNSGVTAAGNSSIAVGAFGTKAQGDYSIAVGANGTIASGNSSAAFGLVTSAIGSASLSMGKFNVKDTYDSWIEWVSGTSYQVGDKVKVTTTADQNTIVKGYICKTANQDAEFIASNWDEDIFMNYVEIVGNGLAYNAYSNARALDWDGNEYLKGDLYVGCNADSTSGSKVATEAFVTARVPAPPVADGTYNLQVSVSSGTATYSWVAAPGTASGVSF